MLLLAGAPEPVLAIWVCALLGISRSSPGLLSAFLRLPWAFPGSLLGLSWGLLVQIGYTYLDLYTYLGIQIFYMYTYVFKYIHIHTYTHIHTYSFSCIRADHTVQILNISAHRVRTRAHSLLVDAPSGPCHQAYKYTYIHNHTYTHIHTYTYT